MSLRIGIVVFLGQIYAQFAYGMAEAALDQFTRALALGKYPLKVPCLINYIQIKLK